jgi:archaellum component FlaF (FlaF/FlaG flagellin family)
MEPEVKKFDWKRLLITLGIILATALIIGGLIYYAMDQQAKKDKETANNQAQDLQKQIDELKSATTSTAANNTTGTTQISLANNKATFALPPTGN